MKYKFFFLLLLFINALLSQSFITPFSSLPVGEEVIVETEAGETITGTIKTGLLAGATILSLTIKDNAGKKHKFKSKTGEMKRIKVRLGELAKLQLQSSALMGGTLQTIVNQDFDEMDNREFAIFERALKPKKKDKYQMMQLLNPGWDTLIKVYQDPSAKKSMSVGGVVGGVVKSYLIVKNGNKSIKLKKKKYKKEFANLFGDCDEMMNKFGNEKIKWNDFAKHVHSYEKICGK